MVALVAPGSPEELLADTPPVRPAVVAWQDLLGGLQRYWLWTSLAVQDIRLRYRGSVLGPFWLTISTLVMVVSMGFIYAHLFHMEARSYLPYLAMGLIAWQLISSLITDGCQTFLGNEAVIQQVPIPFSVHAFRVVYRNFIVLGHNLVLIPLGMVVFHIPLDWHLIEVAFGSVVIAVNGVWVALVLGLLCTRFRDIGPIVASFLQVAFFLTPIFWHADALGKYRPIAEFNPLFAAIDVVRAPLIGMRVGAWSWPVLLVTTVVGSVTAFFIFARFRSRIAYWV